MKHHLPIYYFSKIQDTQLRNLVKIKQNLSIQIFDSWFNYAISLTTEEIEFLTALLCKEIRLLGIYKEEDLKVKFIAPILNKIDFRDLTKEIRDFYEERITYKSNHFILTGVTDFLVAKGIEYSETPYFFIQEFKRTKDTNHPEPQLLAELIAGIELSGIDTMHGAYIVGAIWNFVILQKIAEHTYQYFVSINFDSTKIEDLKLIYKNLLYIKHQIFNMF